MERAADSPTFMKRFSEGGVGKFKSLQATFLNEESEDVKLR